MTLEIELTAAAPIPLAASFAVSAGEMVALVGPSGSGKSTILRAIAGLWRPTGGRVVAGGEIWFDAAERVFVPIHRRAVGMVFQSYALFPHMTAAQNVMAAMGRRADPARAADLLAMVNLAALDHRRPAQLSGGQQQRVAVARALAREPRALLLDEPFSAVDRATREKLYREIADLRRRLTMPVVLVTHDMEEAARLADRIVVLRDGRTLQDGPPMDVLTRPNSPEVARLMGLRNVYRARVARSDDAGLATLDWAGLEVVTQARLVPDSEVDWAVPEAFVRLHRPDRPSRDGRENPVPGAIAESVTLGQTVSLTLRPDHAPDQPLRLSAPLHLASYLDLSVGARATVSLMRRGVHVMGAPAASPDAAEDEDAA
jgi:molybdate transport system ATP-binding protein